MADVFVQSIDNSRIDALLDLSFDETTDTETIYKSLNELKKDIIEHNAKLKQIHDTLKRQCYVRKLLQQIIPTDDDTDLTTQLEQIDELINTNNDRIQRLAELSEAKIDELKQKSMLSPTSSNS